GSSSCWSSRRKLLRPACGGLTAWPRGPAGVAPHGRRAKPSGGRPLTFFLSAGLQRWSFSTDGAVFLPRLFAWVYTSWLMLLGNEPKNNAPHGGATRMRCFAHFPTI